MNQPKKILVALAVMVGAFFLACDPADIEPDPKPQVTAVVDGAHYNSSSVTANLFISANDSTLEIKTVNSDGSSIDLSVKHPKVGTFVYSMVGSSDVSIIYKKAANGITVSETTIDGSVSISAFNLSTKKVSGTFSFNTDDSNITSGNIDNVTFN